VHVRRLAGAGKVVGVPDFDDSVRHRSNFDRRGTWVPLYEAPASLAEKRVYPVSPGPGAQDPHPAPISIDRLSIRSGCASTGIGSNATCKVGRAADDAMQACTLKTCTHERRRWWCTLDLDFVQNPHPWRTQPARCHFANTSSSFESAAPIR